jgi:5-methylthioribose kinase
MSATLDIEQPDALLAYLRGTGHIGAAEMPALRILPGGVSSRTVLVQRPTGEAWVLKQSLPKLRVETDWFSDPARIHREALGLRWLTRLAPPGSVPGFVFEDDDAHLFAMQAVPQPHENWKTMLLAGRIEWTQVRLFGQMLGTIHRTAALRRAELEPQFSDRSFFESLRIEPYYHFTLTQVPAAEDFLGALIQQTRARCLTLVHGDFSPKNILVNNGKLVLLDHEVIHWGDPAFDLGFSLTHFLSKAHHLPKRRLDFARAADQYWDTYCKTIGNPDWSRHLESHAVLHTLACLLARVAGRSPLEYLDAGERARQRAAVVTLMQRRPKSVSGLVADFIARL